MKQDRKVLRHRFFLRENCTIGTFSTIFFQNFLHIYFLNLAYNQFKISLLSQSKIIKTRRLTNRFAI